MSSDFEYIIIGAGVNGSATAYALAQAGKSVALLEQFEFGHERGSSHGNSRIFRFSYGQPHYVDLAVSTLPLWRELEKESGRSLLLQTGGLDLGAPENILLQQGLQNLERVGSKHELLTEAKLRERFPQFASLNGSIGLYHAEAGILDAVNCVVSMIEQARLRGAHCQQHVAVKEIEPGKDSVTVHHDGGKASCKKLIVAAGAWVHKLLAPFNLGIKFKVTKEQYAYFELADADNFKPGRFPIFTRYGAPFRLDDADIQIYGFPVFEKPAIKIASHQTGPVVDPDRRNFALEDDVLQAVIAWTRKALPEVSDRVAAYSTCLYTNTEDGDFIIDTLPSHANITLLSACSGHGFKFGPLTGRIAASVADGTCDARLRRLFSLSRFVPAGA